MRAHSAPGTVLGTESNLTKGKQETMSRKRLCPDMGRCKESVELYISENQQTNQRTQENWNNNQADFLLQSLWYFEKTKKLGEYYMRLKYFVWDYETPN